MAKRRERDLHADSTDPDEPSPFGAPDDEDVFDEAREGREPPPLPPTEPLPAKRGAKSKRASGRHVKGDDPLPEPALPRIARIPPSFLGARALFLLLRIGDTSRPVKLTFVGTPAASDGEIADALLAHGAGVSRRAPRVFDAEVPFDRVEDLLTGRAALFRRVDAPGWFFGEVIEGEEDRAEITVSVDEPPTSARRRDLGRLGLHVVGEGDGELRGVVLGRDVAELLAAHWLGPVEVRRVHRREPAPEGRAAAVEAISLLLGGSDEPDPPPPERPPAPDATPQGPAA